MFGLACAEEFDKRNIYIKTNEEMKEFFEKNEYHFLGNFIIGDEVDSLEPLCLRNFFSVDFLKLPKNLTEIPANFFGNFQQLKSISYREDYFDKDWNLKPEYKDKLIFELPETIIKMGENAFYDCSLITNLELPKHITEIGDYAFAGTGLRFIKVPDTIKKLGVGVFMDNGKLEKVLMRGKIEKLPAGLFENCGSLRTVFLPNTLKEIGVAAFHNCKHLKNFYCNGVIEKIGENAFRSCEKLYRPPFSEKIREIGDRAFLDSGLEEKITLPKGVKVGKYVFFRPNLSVSVFKEKEEVLFSEDRKTLIRYEGWQAESYVIPLGVETIEPEAFKHSKVKKVVLPKGMKKLGYRAFAFSDIKEVELNSDIEEVGEESFLSCRNLEKIHFPEGLKKIGREAFSDTALTSIVLPKSVREVAEFAFGSEVKEITMWNRILITDTVKRWHKKLPFAIVGKFGFFKDVLIHLYDGSDEHFIYSYYFPLSYVPMKSMYQYSLSFGKNFLFDFSKMDTFFENIKEKENQMEFAVARLSNPIGLSEETGKKYEVFLEGLKEEDESVVFYLKHLIKNCGIKGLQKKVFEFVNEELLDILIQMAQKELKMEDLLALMQLKSKKEGF